MRTRALAQNPWSMTDKVARMEISSAALKETIMRSDRLAGAGKSSVFSFSTCEFGGC